MIPVPSTDYMLNFAKKNLGVKQQTPNMAVLGELGRFSYKVLCRERVFNYWLKMLSNPNSIMFSIFQAQCSEMNRSCNNFWASKVKRLLEELGLSYL